MDNIAKTEQLSVILATPVLVESHVRKELRLDLDVVIIKIHEMLICLALKVEIYLLLL